MNIQKPDIHMLVTYCLGGVFILSAVTKVVGLPVFADEMRLYLDIYFGGWLRDSSLFLAGMVCLAELLIGIACLVPALRRQANVAAFLALTFFVWLTGDNYFCPSPFGRIESCGCFGELIHFTPLASFIKSLVLWCMAATNLFYEIHFPSHA